MTNDLNRPLNPTHMRMDVLRSLDVVTIHSLAQSSTGTVTAYKLVLGRCLLAMDESKGYLEYGCSNTVSYATNRLGIPGREARTCRRVAQRLLALPLLTLEAEQGQIDWCKLREISRKASPETEELWVELARKHTYEAIESLVGKTPRGALPGDVDTEGESYLSEFRCRLSPEIFQMLAQARRLYSAELGEVVTNATMLEWVLTSYISQQPLDKEALEKVRREADKDLQAERAREIPAVMEARELAVELGILTDEASRVGQDG